MQYRRDIDGLRALAIMPVLFYHAGFPGFSGGFAGVDIFFVISGFLITSIIAGELQAGEFSLGRFYQRRIRRIFPALFVMLLAVAAAGLFLLAPRDAGALGKTLAATTVFASNILFWRESGYFDIASAAKPLLHTWSLGVEEQFYLLFPLFLMLAWKLGRHVKAAVLAAMAVSFAIAVYAVGAYPSAAFFLLPSRAWELMLGAVLALGIVRAPHAPAGREVLGVLGLGLVAYAVFRLDRSMPFPGINALIPCAGAACLILARGSYVSRLLCLQPVVVTGLVSYSLYLWHWPLMVFMQYGRAQPLTFFEGSVLVMLSGLMACLSWRYVEQPLRAVRTAPATLFRIAALASIGVAALGIGMHAAAGSRALVTWAYGPAFYELERQSVHTGIDADCLGAGRHPCTLGDAKAPVTIALLGDSYADAITMALDESLKIRGLAARPLLFHSCPVIAGTVRNEPERLGPAFAGQCKAFVDGALAYVLDEPAIETVILSSGYRWYMTATGTMDEAPILLPDKATGRTLEEMLLETVITLLGHGKQVVFVGAAPESMPAYGAQALAKTYMRDRDMPAAIAPQAACHDMTAGIAASIPPALAQRFHYVDVTALFRQGDTCRYVKDGMPLTIDGSHVTGFAARMLAQGIAGFLPSGE